MEVTNAPRDHSKHLYNIGGGSAACGRAACARKE
jgi:hypothetical protein